MADISTSVAAIQNFIVRRGDTFGPVVLQFFTSVNGIETAINITGDTFKMLVKVGNGTDPVLSFDINNGFAVQNTNELVLQKSALLMQIPARVYIYDLQRIQANGNVTTEITGNFTVLNDLS
jgi:hypothetical protein